MKYLWILASLFSLNFLYSQESSGGLQFAHKDFSITSPELKERLIGLPESIQTNILENSDQFLTDLIQLFDYPEELLWLVDKQNPLSGSYAPNDLLDLGELGFDVKRDGTMMRRIALADYDRMNRAANDQGITLLISSAYRSYAYQETLFNYWVNQAGYDEAVRFSALPGNSQHQLGTTLDFGSVTAAFAGTPAGEWLMENAQDFGFSLSYPQGREELTGYIWEPWHWRYIGPVAAGLQERWFEHIQQHFLVFWKENKDFLLSRYFPPRSFDAR